MPGECCHVARRLKVIPLLLLCVLLYISLWLYKFQLLSTNLAHKRSADRDGMKFANTLNQSIRNNFELRLQHKSTNNNSGEINQAVDQDFIRELNKTQEFESVINIANHNEKDFKTSDDIKSVIDIKNVTTNNKTYGHNHELNYSNNRYKVTSDNIDNVQTNQSGRHFQKQQDRDIMQKGYIQERKTETTVDHKNENLQTLFKTKPFKVEQVKSKENQFLNQEHPGLVEIVLKDTKKSNKILNPEQPGLIEMVLSDTKESNADVRRLQSSSTAYAKNKRLDSSLIRGRTKVSAINNTVPDSVFKWSRTKLLPNSQNNMSNIQVTNVFKNQSVGMLLNGHIQDNNRTKSSNTTTTRYTFVNCNSALSGWNKTKIGILIPSSTRNIEEPSLDNLTLVNASLPSIFKTLEEQYVYRIYIGIDEGDFLQTVQDEIKRKFACTIPVIVQGKNYVKSVNYIAERAYKDGMDYFVRINDDTLFVTSNWTSLAITKLREYHPENIGVVGPTCKEGNTHILTHDMVHRKHLEIFDFYYPPYLENWWTDDWITRVYEPNKSTKMAAWVVKHIIVKTRYEVDHEREKWSHTLIKYDQRRLQKYMGCSCALVSCASHSWLSASVLLTCILCLIIYFS